MTGVQDLLLVFEWLINRGPCPVDEACERFGVDRETFTRMIDTLASVGEAPFTPDAYLEAYIDDDTDLVHVRAFEGLQPGVSMDREVARLIFVVADALTRLPGFEEAHATRRAAERLGKALSETGVDTRALQADLNVPGADLVVPLRTAVAQRMRLRIRYRSATGSSSQREVDPLGLLHEASRWYLDAFDHQRARRLLFRLDRIEEMEQTGDAVADQLPEHNVQRLGQTGTEAAVKVVLSCDRGSLWLAERLPGATIEEVGDRCNITLQTSDPGWLVPLLLIAGPGARVQEPEELRTMLTSAASQALARYVTG